MQEISIFKGDYSNWKVIQLNACPSINTLLMTEIFLSFHKIGNKSVDLPLISCFFIKAF